MIMFYSSKRQNSKRVDKLLTIEKKSDKWFLANDFFKSFFKLKLGFGKCLFNFQVKSILIILYSFVFLSFEKHKTKYKCSGYTT